MYAEEGSGDIHNSEEDNFVHVTATEDSFPEYSKMDKPEDTEFGEEEGERAPSSSVPSRVEDVPTETLVKTPTREGHPDGYLRCLRALNNDALDVIYWKDIKVSATILVGITCFLITLSLNSFIHSVVLALMSLFGVTLTYCALKIAWDSFHNEPLVNPFQYYLDKPFEVPEELVNEYSKWIAKELSCTCRVLTNLLCFADVWQSIKFLIGIYLISYITPYITVMVALYMTTFILFSVPKVYELYQAPIDKYINLASAVIKIYVAKILVYIPYMGNKKKLE